MKKQISFLIITLFSFSVHGQSTNKEAARLVNCMTDKLLQTAALPGISVAISKEGKIVYAQGFGYADVENKIPVTTKTQFRTASVAKVITATALGKLLGDNKLELDAPIQNYVSSYPKKEAPITTRQLAGHLAGLPHYSESDKIENRPYTSIIDALSVFSPIKLISKPGSAYHYSTHGYTLLSAIIESAAQKPFLVFMQQSIFKPLKMKSTQPDTRSKPNKNLAQLYTLKKGSLAKINTPENTSYKLGAGGFVSTPVDLLRLTQAYFNGFLKPEIVNMMFTSQQLTSGEKTQVGLGWRLSWDADGRRVLEHAGSMGGARTVVCIFPEEQVSIAIMINAEWSSMIEETAHMLALPFLSGQLATPQPKGIYPIEATLTTLKNNKETMTGILNLSPTVNNLILNPETNEEQILLVIYLKKENIYALVRPDGIFRLTLTSKQNLISGEVIGYGSPLAASPIHHPPFLSFKSYVEDITKR